MFFILITFVPLFILIGINIYYSLGSEMNWRFWASLLLLLLFEMFFLYGIVYSFKQLINPTLLITVNETGISIVQDKRNIEIGWEDIESYMICGRPSPGGVVYFYIFLKAGIASTTIPKELKIEYHFMKNPKKLKTAFDENKIKELPPNYDLVKNI